MLLQITYLLVIAGVATGAVGNDGGKREIREKFHKLDVQPGNIVALDGNSSLWCRTLTGATHQKVERIWSCEESAERCEGFYVETEQGYRLTRPSAKIYYGELFLNNYQASDAGLYYPCYGEDFYLLVTKKTLRSKPAITTMA